MTNTIRRGRTCSAVALTGLLTLSACGGGVGSSAGGSSGGDGFEYGADQAAVDEALADLEPTTLTFQSAAPSGTAETANSTNMFKEYVEERSGGKITIDVVWGTGVAAYNEVFDALSDGRLDIAFVAPVYEPDRFPVADALNTVTQYTPTSPVVGEAISAAVMSELGWNSEELLEDTFGKEGVVALSPLTNTGDFLTTCQSEEPEESDWKGMQLRISSTSHSQLAQSVGAVPVSMEFGEAYEALQRGTVDCAMVQAQTAGTYGLIEVASHIYHPDEQRLSSNVPAAYAAGSSFETLPLAYQQIIFDAEAANFEGNLRSTYAAQERVVNDSRKVGGSIQPLPDEIEATFMETEDQLVEDLIAEGRLDAGIREEIEGLVEKWTEIAEESGLEDKGELADFSDWYDADSIDLQSFSERLFTDAALAHRPE